MKVVRTIVWILILVGLLAFSALNWKSVEVTLWSDLVLETKVPALVIVAFLLGLIPMWLVHRGVKWQQGRRIQSLENAVKSSALARHNPAPSPAAADAPPATDDPSMQGGDTLAPTKDA